MKSKIIKSIFMSVAVAGLLTITSCKDYLEVENDSTLAPEIVFSSISYSNAAVTGIYNKLIGDSGYGSRLSITYPLSAEDFKASGDYSPIDRRGISSYGVSPANPELKDPFNQLYQGIERANICIKYIPVSDKYTNGTVEERTTLQRLYGEALTLRAQFYHELIRNWGDLPAQFEPSMDIKNLYLSKTDRDIIYDHILKDLEVAEGLVPWRGESGMPTTRITKAAVKGLRARIALAMGGYSLRRDPQEMTRRSDYKDFYQIAYDECLEIIQHREQHDLNPSFENLFRTLHGTRIDPKYEYIFEVGAFGGDSKTDSKLGFGNGPRINGASTYGEANGQVVAIPTYFYDFDTLDTRRDVTIAYFDVQADDNKDLNTGITMRDGKFRKYWTSIKGSSQNLGINWPVLRFADVLLMFAEADNELKGAPSGAAISAFEEVRKRAFSGNVSKIGVTPIDYTGFFNAIVKERLLEFGGEGIRKYDLIRWGILKNKIQETKNKLTAFMNGTGQYANVPLNVYSKKTKLKNLSVPEERASFDLYGGALSKVLNIPEPGGSIPTDYKKIAWRAAVNDDYINTELKGFASKFTENHSELLPIHNDVLNQNYNLKQDYGY